MLTQILLIATFLFMGCSSDNDNFDNDTFQKIQGKWKLTGLFTFCGVGLDSIPPNQSFNGFELELKANKTFTSNEVSGFSGGTYTVIKNSGTNLKLVYKNGTQKLIRYKYIISVDGEELYLSYSEPAPIAYRANFFEGSILTPVP